SETREIPGCFIPPNLLAGQLSKPALDPQGLRELPEFSPDTGVWLMMHDREWVKSALGRPGFLLPEPGCFVHLAFFLPRGSHEITVAYEQKPWFVWKPVQDLLAQANISLEHTA